MPQKLIAIIAGMSLVTLAAVGVFASQDAITTQEEPTPEATATLQPDATATELPDATETPSPEPTATEFVEATATPDDADDEGEDGDDGDDQGQDGQREIGGIPQSNPNFVDEDGDGECEKGEAVVKTTPSGRQVRVPCHAAKDAEEKHQDKQKDSDANEDDQGEDESEDSN
jgi:hypothetical protein